MSNIDRETFEALKNRMKKKFPVLLEGYVRDARMYLAAVETNVTENGQLAEIIEASHSLKSASGLLGVGDVRDAAEKVEYSAKKLLEQGSEETHSLEGACRELMSAFSKSEDELFDELQKCRSI